MKNTKEVKQFIKNNQGVSGIYAIICTGSWRSYVGSSVNVGSRISSHFQLLKKNKHDNTDLQQDFNKFGIEKFYYEILELTEEYNLLTREKYWYEQGCNLYNKTPLNKSITLSVEEQKRFWILVEIKTENDCWNWTGGRDKDGYGRVVFKEGSGKTRISHSYRSNRLAFYLTYPDANIDLVVRHTCNNSSCCNPKHLILGSYSENRKDYTCDNSKLDWSKVYSIREYFCENPLIKRDNLKKWVENKFNISLPACYLIKLCENEKWIDKNYFPPLRRIDFKIAQDLRQKKTEGLSIIELVNYCHGLGLLAVNKNQITRILRNERFSNI